MQQQTSARVSIRAHTYRNEPGFSIYGTDSRGRMVKIFSKSRGEAERMRDDIKAGREPEFDAFRKPVEAVAA